jgi:hypothetical protein
VITSGGASRITSAAAALTKKAGVAGRGLHRLGGGRGQHHTPKQAAAPNMVDKGPWLSESDEKQKRTEAVATCRLSEASRREVR